MASKGEGAGVGVIVVRDDRVIESRNLRCRSGVAGNGVWVKRTDNNVEGVRGGGGGGEGEGRGKKLRGEGGGEGGDKTPDDDWGGLALTLTISQTLYILNPTCPSDFSEPMGGTVESQPVLASGGFGGSSVVVGTMGGDVVGWR
jgi:hypothetical protein